MALYFETWCVLSVRLSRPNLLLNVKPDAILYNVNILPLVYCVESLFVFFFLNLECDKVIR